MYYSLFFLFHLKSNQTFRTDAFSALNAVAEKHSDGNYLVPAHKWPFYPNSSLLSEFNPWNIDYMPVVKFIKRLDLEQNISSMDRHYLKLILKFYLDFLRFQ